MNLYHFNPNNYGEEAYVCAESKEKAIEALKATKPYATPEDDVACNREPGYSRQCHEEKINRMVNCLDGYTIDEYPMNHVIFSEIA